MKLSIVFIAGGLFMVSSCAHTKTNTNQTMRAVGDTAKLVMKDSNTDDGYPERKVTDSIYKKKMLVFALSYADKNKDKESFTYNSEQLSIDSGDVSIQYGHLFDSRCKHLIIRIPPHRSSSFNMDLPIYVYLYTLKRDHFVLLCSETDSSDYNQLEGYQGDTLQDVNGDGYKDFVVSWYSGCGCCPRDDKHIYLYKPEDGNVSDEFDLLNPTFLPGKRIIYLMDYGQPGQIAIFKCKWEAAKLDTIESIATDTARILLKKNTFYVENEITGIGRIQEGLPKEYQALDSSNLSYFLSAWDK